MIYITGDMHADITRFKDKSLKKLKKGDTLIVCGDFGFVWTGSKREKNTLDFIGKRKYNVLFVDGCNENFKELNSYETSDWCGGKVKTISGNLRYLMRGEIYTIEDKKIFTFGGSNSIEKIDEGDDKKDFEITKEHTSHGIENLELNGDKVDIIITHDAPTNIRSILESDQKQSFFINKYLDTIRDITDFKMWYFGKYHQNKTIPPHYHCLFTDVVKVEI